ncbi:hypothetical protein MID00_19715 [Alcaligenes sp. NLF5-7]|uniref:hypothetical protein n=1 Tax=Alcaligenes sp. NLF5-7 TaxID=2918755 RepID=UPI0020C478EA|nr:hypothetical protein [Alcaligenes sp. NLF5-7]UTM01683.1 hypothetical protein MID00_19715 [Alcaligenes sp. NLF5-7]
MLKDQYREAMRGLVLAEQRVGSAQEALKEAQEKVEELEGGFKISPKPIDALALASGAVTASALQVNGSHISRFHVPHTDR